MVGAESMPVLVASVDDAERNLQYCQELDCTGMGSLFASTADRG
jgi:hypothetical protein